MINRFSSLKLVDDLDSKELELLAEYVKKENSEAKEEGSGEAKIRKMSSKKHKGQAVREKGDTETIEESIIEESETDKEETVRGTKVKEAAKENYRLMEKVKGKTVREKGKSVEEGEGRKEKKKGKKFKEMGEKIVEMNREKNGEEEKNEIVRETDGKACPVQAFAEQVVREMEKVSEAMKNETVRVGKEIGESSGRTEDEKDREFEKNVKKFKEIMGEFSVANKQGNTKRKSSDQPKKQRFKQQIESICNEERRMPRSRSITPRREQKTSFTKMVLKAFVMYLSVYGERMDSKKCQFIGAPQLSACGNGTTNLIDGPKAYNEKVSLEMGELLNSVNDAQIEKELECVCSFFTSD
ncbi:hypothetical protein niasHT_035708 [Heterodera trifolii]|uniref:Uncharacterized protein n=1 Tax=Heterodera trifolii TaxID=157864 RepID=A0ABD2I3Q1_9BILA